MNSIIGRLLDQSGATVADLVIIIMGILFALYVLNREHNKEKTFKEMWSKINENTRLYNQVDKLESNNSLAIRWLSNGKIETMKQSADGKGDHVINRDV